MAQIALNYSAAEINAAVAKINSLVTIIEGNIVQLYNGSTAIYPLTKAEAVFFDGDTSKTLDEQFSQLEQEVLSYKENFVKKDIFDERTLITNNKEIKDDYKQIVDGYTYPIQTIGKNISFGEFSQSKVYNIPAGSDKKIKIITKPGGSYGFALTTLEDRVLKYSSNSVSYIIEFDCESFETLLYASSNKIESIYLIENKQIKEVLDDRTLYNKEKEDKTNFYKIESDGYVKPNQTIGAEITFGSHYKHKIYEIPVNTKIKIITKSGGFYGFALTDKNGFVLEYASNSNNSVIEFQPQIFETLLYASSDKIESIYFVKEVQIKEEIKILHEDLDKNNNYWKNKVLWWCGTSISAGSNATLGSEETIAGNYPTQVGNNLGAVVINKSVGGSMCRANVRTGNYAGANIINITSALSMTKIEIENFINNYDSIRQLPGNSNWPISLSTGNINRMRAASFEDRLLPYLNGTYDMPSLFVIDHGHHDLKYKMPDGSSDIGLQPILENINSGVLAVDSYMTNNDNEKLKTFFGNLEDIPSGSKASFIASLNRNCYIGAVNFIITLILHYNPHARIVFISNYEYEYGYITQYAPLIPAQEFLSNSWAFPLCEVYKYVGFSRKWIPGSKNWFNEHYPNVTPLTTDANVFLVYNPDRVHPHSDITGDSNKIIAGVISEFIKTCR